MPSSVLKINGTPVDRPEARVVIDRLTLRVGDSGADSLEFTEVGVELPGSFGSHAPCSLEIDSVVVFRGVVVASHPAGVGGGPINVGHVANGLEWLANRIPVTAPDGTGSLAYNLRVGDDGHAPSLAGLSVGDILDRLFDLHAAALSDAGISPPSPADLAALVVVPPEPVRLSGGLWAAARSLLTKWCNKFVMWIEPADGSIKIKSQLADLTPLAINLDADPVVINRLSRDHGECASALLLRGGPDVQAAYLDFAGGGLAKGWTPTEEAAYLESDFSRPSDASDLGDITALTSATVTVQSDDASRTWPVNHWSSIAAEIVLSNPAATGIEFSESRRVTANAPLSAGGTAVLTLDPPLVNSGYSRYSIRGLYSAKALVWRKILVTHPYLNQRLVQRFPAAVPFSPVDGSTVMTNAPAAVICHSAGCSPPFNEFPLTFDVVPHDGTTNGHLVFHAPVNKPFGGPPCEIKALVPYSRGALSVRVPASGHEGTAHSVDGLERTLVVDRPDWLDLRDSPAMNDLAREMLDCVKNTVIEGSLTHYGSLPAALVKGAAISLTRDAAATGYESAVSLARSVTVDWAPLSSGAVNWIVRVDFSNRLKPFTGDRLYSHPAWRSSSSNANSNSNSNAGNRGPNDRGSNRSADQRRDDRSPRRGEPAPSPAPSPDLESPPPNHRRKPAPNTGLSPEERLRVSGRDHRFNLDQADGRESERRARQSASDRAAAQLRKALGKPSPDDDQAN